MHNGRNIAITLKKMRTIVSNNNSVNNHTFWHEGNIMDKEENGRVRRLKESTDILGYERHLNKPNQEINIDTANKDRKTY